RQPLPLPPPRLRRNPVPGPPLRPHPGPPPYHNKRGWRMEDGGWRMEDGGWRMEDGGWRMENPNFQFSILNFQFSPRLHTPSPAPAAVTSALPFPLIPPFATHIVGGYGGDNFEYLWKVQWFADALASGYGSPVFAPQVFYPTGADLTISELTPAHTLLGAPLT